MSTPTIPPQPQESQVKKTLLFLDQYFPERKELGLECLKQLLLNPDQRLPAIVIHIQLDSSYYPTTQLATWLESLLTYVKSQNREEARKDILILNRMQFLYFHTDFYRQLERAGIYNPIVLLAPNEFKGASELAIIPLPTLPEIRANMEELENEIPDFVSFLQSRTAYYPKSGELYFGPELLQKP